MGYRYPNPRKNEGSKVGSHGIVFIKEEHVGSLWEREREREYL